jgi:hypothetical protein
MTRPVLKKGTVEIFIEAFRPIPTAIGNLLPVLLRHGSDVFVNLLEERRQIAIDERTR